MSDLLPFSEPYWHKTKSPYYNESHYEWQKKLRKFVDKHIIPFCDKWDESGDYDLKLHSLAYNEGIYGAMWPKEYGGTPPNKCDMFHDLIMIDELSRCGTGGVLWSCFYAFGIALPPILDVGSKYLKDLVCKDVITGKKIMSLAITEPNAGSDVANIKTTAILCNDNSGDYIINGEKYFITAGMKADYFTVGARTDLNCKGFNGVTLFLVEKTRKGVFTSRMKTAGWWSSTTTYIVFKNVRVPAKNIIGTLNQGFKPIMHNFNHERFIFATMSIRFARVCLNDAIKYAKTRKTFGKPLIKHQVIRHKIANMAKKIESAYAYLEQITYKMDKYGIKSRSIGADIALLKHESTKCMEYCAREAVQIFGGRGYLRGGRASRVERLYREVRVMAIAGGSEEIMLDLAMRASKL